MRVIQIGKVVPRGINESDGVGADERRKIGQVVHVIKISRIFCYFRKISGIFALFCKKLDGGRDGGTEGWKDRGAEARRDGGTEARKEGGMEGGMEKAGRWKGAGKKLPW
jgi:hypothetical protein